MVLVAGVAAGAAGCIIPFAVPPMRAEVGAASRTGDAPSREILQVAVGSHLAGGLKRDDQTFDVGAGWLFQHDFREPDSASVHGLYVEAERFIVRTRRTRTGLGLRGELQWMPDGVAPGAKVRIDHELFGLVDKPFSSNDKCGTASGVDYGTGGVGLFTEAGATRLPDGTTAWTATAGVALRIPAAVGVWIGIPYCK